MHTDTFFICLHHDMLPTSITKEFALVVPYYAPQLHNQSVKPFFLPPDWFSPEGVVADTKSDAIILPYAHPSFHKPEPSPNLLEQ